MSQSLFSTLCFMDKPFIRKFGLGLSITTQCPIYIQHCFIDLLTDYINQLRDFEIIRELQLNIALGNIKIFANYHQKITTPRDQSATVFFYS